MISELTPKGMQVNKPIRVAVLTVSDRCSRGDTVDTSGPALATAAREGLRADVVAEACVPDCMDTIAHQLLAWVRTQPAPDLILTTGGTGLASRDLTPEATLRVLERHAPGLMELIRFRCASRTPRVFLSRGVAGLAGRTLIINLPGSQRGAVECFEALMDILPHAIESMRGEIQDDGRPDALPLHGKVVVHHD